MLLIRQAERQAYDNNTATTDGVLMTDQKEEKHYWYNSTIERQQREKACWMQ